MLAFKMLCKTAFDAIRRVLYDKTLLGPVTVMTSVADTYGAGGRKKIKLSNGWWIAAVRQSTSRINVQVSKDNCATWEVLCFQTNSFTVHDYAMVAMGDDVGFLWTYNNLTTFFVRFTAATVGNVDISALPQKKTLDSAQSAMDMCTIKIGTDGVLHALWASKNASLPNSLNIRASKSSDDGATWSAPVQLTNTNTSGYNKSFPTLAALPNGRMATVYNVAQTSINNLYCDFYDGVSWAGGSTIVVNGSYAVTRPVLTTNISDVLYLVYDAIDSGSSGSWNVYTMYSTDGGLNWSSPLKMTAATGGSNHMYLPTIATDMNGYPVILYSGAEAGMNNRNNIYMRKWNGTTWDNAVRLTYQVTAGLNENYAQVADDFHDFDVPPFIWTTSGASTVRSMGAHYVGDIRYDRTRGVVVDAAHDISGNGGRKITHLSNGWVVSITKNGTTALRFEVSKDGMATWQLLTSKAWGSATYGMALASVGTTVHAVVSGNDILYGIKFDALTVGADFGSMVQIDSSQTAMGANSITAHTDGSLHATWVSKNATRPNSFNVSYSKSINGVAWDAPTRLTTQNNSTQNHLNPCIVIKADGTPFIVSEYQNTTDWYIEKHNFIGGAWQIFQTIYQLGFHQYGPCATVDSNGVIRVVWYGHSISGSTSYGIRYSESSDNGATFSAMEVVYSEGSYNQYYPSITVDKDNVAHIVFEGTGAFSTTVFQMRYIKGVSGAWGSVTNLTTNSVTQRFASLCDNYRDFIEPICMWQDNQTPSIKCRGKWYEESEAA